MEACVEADELPEILPPKRRRPGRLRSLHPVLATAAADSELHRLSQEFPKHNWLEQKIRQTSQNDMNQNSDTRPRTPECKTDSDNEKTLVNGNDEANSAASTDIENQNDDFANELEEDGTNDLSSVKSENENEIETEIDESKVETLDLSSVGADESSELVIDEHYEEQKDNVSCEKCDTEETEDQDVEVATTTQSLDTTAESEETKPNEMEDGSDAGLLGNTEESCSRKALEGDEKAALHQGFWTANAPIPRKKTPVQRVQPQIKLSDLSSTAAHASAPTCAPSCASALERPPTTEVVTELTASADPEPAPPHQAPAETGDDDQITIRRFIDEIRETIERNVENIAGPSSDDSSTIIPTLKPLIHPPIQLSSSKGDTVAPIPKLIPVYETGSESISSEQSTAAARDHGVFIDSANAVMAISAMDVTTTNEAPEAEENRKRPADGTDELESPKVARTEEAPPPNQDDDASIHLMDEAQQKELARLRAEFQRVDALIAIKEREKQNLMVTRNKLGVLIAKIGIRLNTDDGQVVVPRTDTAPSDGSPPLKPPDNAQGPMTNAVKAHRTRSTVPRHLLYPDKFSRKDILNSTEMKSRCREGLAKKVANQQRVKEAASRSRGQPSPWKRYSQSQMIKQENLDNNALNLSSQPAPTPAPAQPPPKTDVVDLTGEKSESAGQELQLAASVLVSSEYSKSPGDKKVSEAAMQSAHVVPSMKYPPVRQRRPSDPHTYAVLGALGFTELGFLDPSRSLAQSATTQAPSNSVASVKTTTSSPSVPTVASVAGPPVPPVPSPAISRHEPGRAPLVQETIAATSHVNQPPRSAGETRPQPQGRSPSLTGYTGLPPNRVDSRRTPPNNDHMSHEAFVRMATQQAMHRTNQPRPIAQSTNTAAQRSHGVIRHNQGQSHPAGYMYSQASGHAYAQAAQTRRDTTGAHKPSQHSPPGLHSPQQPMIRPNMVQYRSIVPAQYQHQLFMEQQLREQQMRAQQPRVHPGMRQTAPQFIMPGHMEPRHVPPVHNPSEMPVYMERVLGQLPPGHEMPVHPSMPMPHSEPAQLHHNQVRQMEAARHQAQQPGVTVGHSGQYPAPPRPTSYEPKSQQPRVPGVHQPQPERFCFTCHQGATYLCSGCKKVWFCSGECQMKGWVAHSKDCLRSSNGDG